MENTFLNSPSRLPAPKSRKSVFRPEDLPPKTAALTNAAIQEPILLNKRPLETDGGLPIKKPNVLPKVASSLQNVPTTSTVRTYKAGSTKPIIAAASKPLFVQPAPPARRQSLAVAGKNTAAMQELKAQNEALKEQYEECLEAKASCEEALANSQARIGQLEMEKGRLEARLGINSQEDRRLNDELRESRALLERTQHDLNEALGQKESLLRSQQGLLEQQAQLQEQGRLLQARLAEQTSQNEQLSLTISRNAATIVDLQSQVSSLRAIQDQLETQDRSKAARIAELSSLLAEAEARIAELGERIQVGERIRRRLHNEVQELKGNIRVFCRIRPLLPGEAAGEALDSELLPSHIRIGGSEGTINEGFEQGRQETTTTVQMVQSGESANGGAIQKSFDFTFDRVFGPAASQEAIFYEISQLVQSALDGYRVCIFAYGQTGSGKTFTMEGSTIDSKGSLSIQQRSSFDDYHSSLSIQAGMIPRAVEQIFVTVQSLKAKGWLYEFEASYLEIYNEAIRDLLEDQSASSSSSSKHEIRHTNGKTTVTDLTIVPVDTPEQVLHLLARAGRNRAVAETQCNNRSSRSHSVFTLRLTGHNTITEERIEGLLNLIDLAGSERLTQSGSTGDRLKETQAINKSLSSLGDVIYALANREAHVPFRNSKLTYLLQHSLGGNCKTLMFVNVNPAIGSFQESLCSLRFATKVNSCQIGTARRVNVNNKQQS